MPSKYFSIYFGPDMDPSWNVNPGVLLDLQDFVPTKRNTLRSYLCTDVQDTIGGSFSPSTYGVPLFGKVLKKIDGTARLIVGTKGRLMESNGSAWTDRSVSGNYSSAVTDWAFTSFGNDIIACNKWDATQISSGAAFSNLTGAPKAQLCCTQLGFVMLADYDDGTNNYGDGWACSALYDDSAWTPSLATQAARGRLVDTPGKITALVALRDSVVAYKEDSIYVGDYIGDFANGIVWGWRLISDRVGCAAPNGVAVVDGVHYFIHRSGVYRFDGSPPTNIGLPVNQFVTTKYGDQIAFSTSQAVVDEYEGLTLWYFRDSGAATNERRRAIAFNKWSGKWGYIDRAWFSGTGTCNAVVQATLSDLKCWSAALASAASEVMTIGNETGSNVLRLAAFGTGGGGGGGASATLTGGHFGDDAQYTTVTRVKPRALILSGGMILQDFTKANESDGFDPVYSFTNDLVKKRWDGTKSARWHKFIATYPTPSEIAGLQIDYQLAGTE